MTQIRYSNLNTEGAFDIKVDGVKVGTLRANAEGQWVVDLPASRRRVTRASLESAKAWVAREFD